MITYVLILTLVGSSGSPAVTAVPGFATMAECKVAGAAWDKLIGWTTAHDFVCVEQGRRQ